MEPLYPIAKICASCNLEKPLSEYFQRKNGRYEARCRDCIRAADRERNHKRRPRKTPTIPKSTKEGHKICNTCLEEMPHEAFSPDKSQKDGYTGRCKQCRSNRYQALPEEEKNRIRQMDKESRLPRIEQRREYDRKRHNTDEHRAKCRERAAVKRVARLLAEKHRLPTPAQVAQISLFRICPRCKAEKFLCDFPMAKRYPGGYGGYCKECNRKWTNSEEEKARQRTIQKKLRRDPIKGQAIRNRQNIWRRKHPQSQQEMTLRRLARKKAAMTERVSLARILERDGYWCYICEKPIDPNAAKKSHGSLAFDHVIPLSPRAGEPQGTHSENNIRPVHLVCNSRKHNKPIDALTPFDRQGP